MKKKLFLALLCIMTMFNCVGCSEPTEATEATENLERAYSGKSMTEICIYVDETTGVNYFVFSGYNKGGITPRYNADGSLYVSYTE